jgi:hypothetical protein
LRRGQAIDQVCACKAGKRGRHLVIKPGSVGNTRCIAGGAGVLRQFGFT